MVSMSLEKIFQLEVLLFSLCSFRCLLLGLFSGLCLPVFCGAFQHSLWCDSAWVVVRFNKAVRSYWSVAIGYRKREPICCVQSRAEKSAGRVVLRQLGIGSLVVVESFSCFDAELSVLDLFNQDRAGFEFFSEGFMQVFEHG